MLTERVNKIYYDIIIIKLYDNTVISNKCLFVDTYQKRLTPSRNQSCYLNWKSVDWFLHDTKPSLKGVPKETLIMITSFVI